MTGSEDTRKIRVVCLGDSITYGYPLGPQFSWVEILRQKTGLQLVNRGVNGDTTGNMLSRFRSDVLELGATYVHLLGGANDAWLGVNLPVYQRNLKKMVELSIQHDIVPLVGLPTPVCLNPGGAAGFFPAGTQLKTLQDWLDQCRDWLREYTRAHNVLLVDYYRPLCIPGTGDGDPVYFQDECHLNEHGYGVMAATALNAVHHLL